MLYMSRKRAMKDCNNIFKHSAIKSQEGIQQECLMLRLQAQTSVMFNKFNYSNIKLDLNEKFLHAILFHRNSNFIVVIIIHHMAAHALKKNQLSNKAHNNQSCKAAKKIWTTMKSYLYLGHLAKV